MSYVVPSFDKKSFNCPNCRVYSSQIWKHYFYDNSRSPFGIGLKTTENTGSREKGFGKNSDKKDLSIAYCLSCEKYSVWLNELMISPNISSAPLPVKDMPREVLNTYNEASSVLSQSPKSSCALLRLALQKLCVYLGGKGRNINEDIKFLVEEGLPKRIQKSLDIIRIVGNNAVHPGTIDIDDNPEIANYLFKLINLIVETMISQPLEIDNLYESMPKNLREAITKRDTK